MAERDAAGEGENISVLIDFFFNFAFDALFF